MRKTRAVLLDIWRGRRATRCLLSCPGSPYKSPTLQRAGLAVCGQDEWGSRKARGGRFAPARGLTVLQLIPIPRVPCFGRFAPPLRSDHPKLFDRDADGAAVHIEDFAQVFGVYPEEKYKKASYSNIAAVIGAEGGDHDIAEFVRRLTFNFLIGNADMHLKNWSLIYPDRRAAVLSPAYDFVSTVAYIPDDKAALNVSRTKRFDQFSEDELSRLAARARLPEALVLGTARETVALFRECWGAEKAHLPISAAAVAAIEAHLETIPLAQGDRAS